MCTVPSVGKSIAPAKCQQRGFPATAAPYQCDELTLGHIQCDFVQCAHALAVRCVCFADRLQGKNCHASNRAALRGYFSSASAFSIAELISFESGSTFESNRAITLPSGPIRNFVKFQPISPPVAGFTTLSVRNA